MDTYEMSDRLPANHGYEEEEEFNLKMQKVLHADIHAAAIEKLRTDSLRHAESLMPRPMPMPPSRPQQFKFAFKLPNPYIIGGVVLLLLILLRR